MIRTWLNALSLLLVLECTNTLSAQEAASDVVGFIEVNVVPGKSEPLAPLFLPALSGSGTVKAVADAGRLTPEWFGVLPEPNDTAAWFPLSGAFIGTPIFGLEIEDSKDWSISPDFRGNPFTGAAPDSPLQVSDRFAVVPFWTVDELAGPADSGSVFSSPSRAQADTFSFAGNTVWAGKPETDLARWVTWVSENPGDEDVGSSVIPDVMGPAAYLRNSVATSPIRLFVHGAARPSALSFHIMPGVEGATEPPVTPLFRPDGKEFTLSSHLGLYTNNPATGLVGGAGPETADKLVIWSADIQEWERFYYKTTAPIGWKSLRPRTINPATIKVPSGSSFFVERPSTRPALKLSLPTIPNAALVNTTLFAQIIDTDKDRLADGWEKTAGDKTLAMLPGADGDGDGFTNLEEYLLGGDPVVFDHPAMPLVEVRVLPTGVREAWLTFTTSLGCRYRVEKRLATSTSWAAIGAILTGTGDELEVKDPVALSTVDRAPRFYRVVGLAPADTDADLLSDFEEVSVYETNPATADTDLDGVKDGAEVRTAGRNPLDYYDGRAVSFLVDAVSDRQVTAPGQWLRQSIAFTAKSGTKALINAPVTFSLTNGAGKFSVVPGDDAAAMPVLTVRTDASGKARAFLYVASASGIVQGRAVARVNDAGSGTLDQIYSASFITYVSPHLTVPTEGLVRWFRPDVGVNRVPSSAEVASWSSVEDSGVASAVNQIGPTQITDLGRAWLAFTGTEKLDMGSGLLPNNTFNAFFTAAPSYTRTEPAPSVASTALNAGATGQAYLLAGETVNGQTVIVYDPPAKPADRSFSIWTITDFRAYNGDTIFRKYAFPTATGRHDGTDGYRNTPAPVGDHNPVTQAGIEPSFATSFPNHRFDSSYTRTVNFNTSLGFKYAEERFYKVYATDWKGNSASATYGGVKRIDYSRVGAAGLGLSVGANSTGAFELHQYWKPAISANGIYSSATGFSTPKTFIGSLRVVNKIPYLDVGGYRRITGSTAYSKSTAVLAPRFIGGWETTGNGYKGKLGDLLLYNRDLTTAECYQVEDYLAASYRGVYELDRDKDTLPDWWERAFFGNYAQAAAGDSDGDTSNNAEEYAKGTHPGKGDTDGDGWSDKLEITKKSNPLTWDSDYDLIADALDTLFLNASNGQADADNNGIADGIDQLILNHDLQDSDSDGISDMLEAFWLSTGVLLDDSDGDLLPDGFEFYGGLDPLDSTGNNGTHGNPDNDGLDNLDELIYSTNPSAADTDGDGVNDGVEINQGTDPNKLGDGGTPPPPEKLIDVPFSVGDSSGSHSERWAMKIVSTNSALDSKTLNFQAPSFGEVGSKTFKLRKGCGYTLTLQHLGTDPEYLKGSQGKPDYDWTAKVDNKPSSSVLSPDETGQYFAITGNGATWIVDNSSGLLGSSDDSLGEQGNKTVGLAASLLPMELAPEKIASNGDFDEGDTGGIAAQQTGAIADNRNQTLIAKRDSVDGRVHAGDLVTDDLHQGWFGLRPGVMSDEFFDGATVTITRKSKTDPDTGKPSTGRVRFFATWGDKQELALPPDDPEIDDLLANNSAPRNLVGKVYGTNKTVPSGATFWIEGVAPGKITLEYRIQKGSTDIKHEQTFEVRTEWTKAQWLAVVRDEIYLDSFTSSSGAGKNGFNNTGIDMNQYVVANDFLPNRPYIYSVYEYYAKLHDKERDKFLWAGLAKLAGGPVYAGMSDAQYGKEGAAIPRGAGIIVSTALQNIQDLLIDANINIYNDLAYQFVAFRTGGIKSMKYLKDQGTIDGPVYDAWKQLDEDGDVSSANQTLLQREQRDILRITYLNLDAMLDGWVSWMFSILTNNPIPGGPSFQTVIPNGNIAIYNDRWAWITDAQQGMWPLWMSKPNTQRQSLANQNLRSNAAGFSLFLNLLPLR
jgi:hypothetical protein